MRLVFEPLLKRYNADVYLSGHVHTFERSFPVFDGLVYLGNSDDSNGGHHGGNDRAYGGDDPPLPLVSTKMVYERPGAPVHIINGAGGNIEVLSTVRRRVYGSCLLTDADTRW